MYTDQTRIEAYLERDLNEEELVIFDEVIASISDFIKNYTNREWLDVDAEVEEIEATERIYDGNGSRELFVDEFSELEAINLLDSQGNINITYTSDTDFMTLPHNSTVKNSIILRNSHFTEGVGNVSIEAIWDNETVPDGVVSVCTALVANYLTRTGETGFKKESIEGYSYELSDVSNEDKDLIAKLDMYKRFVL